VVLTATMALSPGASTAQSADPGDMDELLRLNEIQTIGSHNSYHLLPSAEEQGLLWAVAGGIADTMQYEHRELPVQFSSQKVRQIELDVFVDDTGGKYTNPLLRTFTGLGPYQPDIMNQPGHKVFHVQDVDY